MGEQKPSLGRIVLFTAYRGHEEKQTDEYAAIVTRINEDETVELATFGPNSVYFQHKIPFNSDGISMTWRWPPRV